MAKDLTKGQRERANKLANRIMDDIDRRADEVYSRRENFSSPYMDFEAGWFIEFTRTGIDYHVDISARRSDG